MRTDKNVFYLSIAIALLILSSTPQLSSAALVWSETFDELDPQIWTTQNCGAEDGCLRGEESELILAYRSNTVSVGTWKLELEEIGRWSGGTYSDICRMYFMCPNVPTAIESYLALSLIHAASTEGDYFNYRIEKYHDGARTYLDTYSGEAKETTLGILHQFAITRTSEGLITVYLNGSQILQAVDTDIDTTEYFGFFTFFDYSLDNIEVYDSIEIGGGLPLILVVAGVGITVVLVVVVLLIRRR